MFMALTTGTVALKFMVFMVFMVLHAIRIHDITHVGELFPKETDWCSVRS